MNASASSRGIGTIILLIRLFLIGIDIYLVVTRGTFYGIAAFLGPVALCYGLSVLISPPLEMPQTKLDPIHSRLLGVGAFLGIIFVLLLKFGVVSRLFS